MRGSGGLAFLAFATAFALAFYISPLLLEHKAEAPLAAELDNGLTVIIREDRAVPIVAIDAFGARNNATTGKDVSH